jgi:glyoxylase-like metal-dependent hydrolase (beta-lactamase superfamily II)
MITIRVFEFNSLQENTYLLFDRTREAIIVDAGCYQDHEVELLTGFISANDIKVKKYVNTHLHVDHMMGVPKLKRKYDVPWLAHEADTFLLETAKEQAAMLDMKLGRVPRPNRFTKDGDEIQFGNSRLKVIHVPGHTPGSIALFSPVQKFVIVGDLIFQGGIGRTDLPGGNSDEIMKSITGKVLTLGEGVKIFSGHGPATSVKQERANNPFLQEM